MLSSKQAVSLVRGMREAGLTLREIRAMMGYGSAAAHIRIAAKGRITARNHHRIRVMYELLARQGRVNARLLDDLPPAIVCR
jgi:hypothetical protein